MNRNFDVSSLKFPHVTDPPLHIIVIDRKSAMMMVVVVVS